VCGAPILSNGGIRTYGEMHGDSPGEFEHTAFIVTAGIIVVRGEIPRTYGSTLESGNPIDDRVATEAVADGGALRHELRALRRSEAALRDFMETATIALHWVDADGRLLWANRAELDLLGYTPQDYLGRSIAEFHADEAVIKEILACLSRGETLRDYPARLRHRDGSIRHVLIDSSVLFENGEFIHTRCFTRDVTALLREQASSLLLGAIVESSDDAIISKDLNGVIMSWNKSAQRLFGYTPDEAIGKTVAELLIPLDRQDEEPRILARLHAGERVDHFETVRRRRDGSLVDISLTISPVRDPHGRIVGASKIARDITERKRAEQVRAQLSAIVESSGDAIYVYDFDGRILTWNRAAEELYGYKEREIVGRNVDLIIPPDLRSELRELINPASLDRKIVRNLESRRMRRDGSTFTALLTVSPVRDEAGKALGLSVISRDTSDQKRNEESLRETQKLESLGLLAGGIAHDFNNLLTGVIGNASLLAEEFAPGSMQAETVQSLIDASERMARLTSQMLAYSGRGHFVIEPVDLSKQVVEITSLIRASIPKTVDLRLTLSDELPLVEADISQLQQVIMNLVINAAESIGNDWGIVEVRTAVQIVGDAELRANVARTNPSPGEYAVIIVEDTGAGMDKETLARIFDPFFTTKFTGRGLGLSSVLGIVRGHRGLMDVESRPGAGTKFRVFFPICSQRVPAQATPRIEPHGKGTVLVVDDEDIVRRMAKMALQRLGYSVVTAVNGQEAVELYAADPRSVDVVLLDMTMPVMGGEETLTRLLEIRPDVTVVAMSGFHEREAKQRFGARITGFVQKPFTAGQLGAQLSAARRPNAR
jgi:two-component system cell cycle sensor histidine kinase/response regulator CckA